MKKILLFIFLFIIIINVKALTPRYTVEEVNIYASVQSNGDLLVKELILLDGAFNGYERELYFKGNYHLYDASNLKLIRVCEGKIINNNMYVLADEGKCFKQVTSGKLGDSYVYQQNTYNDHIKLRMYNYNPTGKRGFYIEYLLEDVIVIHNDIAELYYTFIGVNFDDYIRNLKITIELPEVSKEFRGWAHGPLTGVINLVDNKKIIATINNLNPNELVDIRMVFDQNIVPLGTKLSNNDALTSIINEEQIRADEANRQRMISALIYYGITILNSVWLIGLIPMFLYSYLRFDKEYRSNFNLEYYREFSGNYEPPVVEYLLKKNITPLSLSSSILNIISKKGLIIEENPNKRKKDKDYKLIKSNQELKESLTKEEEYIINWLINDYGNSKEVTLKDIRKASRNINTSRRFLEKYDEWSSMIRTKTNQEDFYYDNILIKFKLGIYSFIGLGLLLLTTLFNINNITIYLIIVGLLLFTFYIIRITKRTKKGNDHYVKWKAFRKFLLDFGRFKEKELPEVILWEKYLVYATVLGIADKVSKSMAIKVKEMNMNNQVLPFYFPIYLNYFFIGQMTNTINTTKRLSHSTIARTQASSGRGFGGGFSGGGGFGGGGLGGGGRGF